MVVVSFHTMHFLQIRVCRRKSTWTDNVCRSSILDFIIWTVASRWHTSGVYPEGGALVLMALSSRAGKVPVKTSSTSASFPFANPLLSRRGIHRNVRHCRSLHHNTFEKRRSMPHTDPTWTYRLSAARGSAIANGAGAVGYGWPD